MRRYFFSTLLCLTCMACLAQPKVVAHRGYWMTEGSAQNSIASLQKAAEIGCWGSEFDVWMTADGIPVVFHDATIDGIRIEDTTYATLMNHIFEIKQHRNEKRDCRISELSVELVNMLGLADRTDYISFSKHVCKRIHELAPKAKVAYLNGELSPKEIKELGWTGIDYNSKVFDKHPDWPLEAKRLGLEVNVWTVDGEEALTHYAQMPGIDIITTNEPEKLIRMKK